MNELDRTRVVLRSMEGFEALRSVLAYLRSISVVFETRHAGGHLAALRDEIEATAPSHLTEPELGLLKSQCSRAAMHLHLALLYTAVGFYEALVETNPALRYDELDEVLEAARRNGLLDSMRELRNAVFHVRPSVRSHELLLDVVSGSKENALAWNRLEDLLFDATERVFRDPEALFQEKKEVLEEGFRRALAYYEEHLAQKSE